MPSDSPAAELARYDRQTRFAPLGEEGQRRLGTATAAMCGCGARGTAIAQLRVRAGVGKLRIIDRDFVELSNLQRQTLFDEDDARAGLPKAVAAADKLRRINSTVAIEPIVADLGPDNVLEFCAGAGVILDGTDNFETRFLINDAALKLGIPWVYGGCVAAAGQSMTILPSETACLRCLLPDCPAPGSIETCQSAGILGPIVGVIAAIEATEAIKILSGHREAISRQLTVIDVWENQLRRIDVARLRDEVDCPACRRGEFSWLSGRHGSRAAVLCGRNAVQLNCPGGKIVPLDELAQRLAGCGKLTRNQYLLRLEVEGIELTIFADGRAIVSGTDDIAAARAIYVKYVGA